MATTSFPEAHPNPRRSLRVIGFGGGFNLPIWTAQREGFFAREGLDVRLDYTPGSRFQITQLLAGNYDLAMTAFDNVVAYRAGQGEAFVPPDLPIDLVSVMGSDDGFLSLVAQPRISRVEDLRGETVTVDALTTGFAFVLREILRRHGVDEREVRFERAGGVADRFQAMRADPAHAATLLMTPFELQAEAAGMRTLVRARQQLGAYLGMTAAVRASWAERNAAAVAGFIRAYQAAVAWLVAPGNRPVAEAVLLANTPRMTPAVAAAACEILLARGTGFFSGGELDPAGMRTVLALRGRYGGLPQAAADPAAYIDRRYLEAASGNAG